MPVVLFLSSKFLIKVNESSLPLVNMGLPLPIITSIFFTLIMTVLYFIAIAIEMTILGRTESYDNLEITPGKLCRGGPYTWQGNSARARMCRNMYSKPEGKAQIDRYSCGSGFTGMPGRGFEYTPISDDRWNNRRCEGSDSDLCDLGANGIF